MFIGINFIGLKLININIFKRSAYINSYNVKVFITAKPFISPFRKTVYVKNNRNGLFISFYINIIIFIYYTNIFINKEILFKLFTSVLNFLVYVYIINVITAVIIAKNNLDTVLKVLRNFRLKCIIEFNYKNYFYI